MTHPTETLWLVEGCSAAHYDLGPFRETFYAATERQAIDAFEAWMIETGLDEPVAPRARALRVPSPALYAHLRRNPMAPGFVEDEPTKNPEI